MDVRFLNGGFCRGPQAVVDRRTWRITRFHAVFVALAHPRHGWVLIDTGYSDRFCAATRGWPRCLYRWTAPVRARENVAITLRKAGIDAAAVRHVVVTHFHGDHIGGLRDLPAARFHFVAEGLADLRALRPLAQTRNAFPPDLLPDDFDARAEPVSRAALQDDAELGLPTHDLFGDGTLRLVDLPGHAPGHVGVFFDDGKVPVLYAADAFWHWREIEDGVEPMAFLRWFVRDLTAYRRTVQTLARLHHDCGLRVLACHCPRTQQHVALPD